MSSEIEVFRGSTGVQSKLPGAARASDFPQAFREVYNDLLTQALREFPPIEGYETIHVLLAERAVYFYVKQKWDESKPIQTFDLKNYRLSISAFLRTIDSLLKEARSISAEVTFKHNFVRQVLEVIDRCVSDTALKGIIARELSKLADATK